MDTISTCPLSHTCEDARDGKLFRCRWYVMVQGQHPSTGEIIDRWDCAIAWGPVLAVEVARTNRGTQAAVESFRNNHNSLHSISHNFLAELANRADKRRLGHEPAE